MRSKLRRALFLLLCAVLLAALFPFSALAYPPDDGDATHKHNWQITYQRQPSCEEDGIIIWTCSACGKEYREYPPAIGHDWDEGKVTREPEGLTAGERTYTCKNDPSHTRTEAINPILPLIQAQLGWVWIDPYTFGLHITVHPEGGRITRGGSDKHTMTVEAEGGIGNYTYTWYYVDNTGSISPGAVDVMLSAGSDVLLKGYAGADVSFLDAYFASIAGTDKENWLTVDPDAIPSKPDLFGSRKSGCLGVGEASYSADTGNCSYYCVVTDEAGWKATSHTARVEYRLGVRTQPEDTNLPAGGEARLFCEACDGTGSYTYTWKRADGSKAEGWSNAPGELYVQEPGEYLCVISDGAEEISTRTATVFEAETLAPVDWSKDVTMWPEEETELFAEFTGGTPPYTCVWTQNGETVATDSDDTPRFIIMAKNNQNYLCTVTDDRGQISWVVVRAGVRELEIAKQPESCYLPSGGYAELSIEMAESGDYRYLLIRNADHTVLDENNTGVFKVYETGGYNIGVYEHAHPSHYALSNYAVVMEDVLRITEQTESAVITNPNQGAYLSVTVEGGKPPYSYDWLVYENANVRYVEGWGLLSTHSSAIQVTTPTRAFCRVEDSEGHKVVSKYIDVTYTGDAPLITLQPDDVTFEYAERSQDYSLYCDAIPGAGGKAEDLIFEWYFKAPGFYDFIKLGSDRSRKIQGGIYYPGCNGYSPTRNCGWYYCKVTDTATGKSTTSRIATVDVELSVTDAKFIDKSAVFGCGKIRYSLQGGYGPYTVEFWGYWRTGGIHDDQRTPVLAATSFIANPAVWDDSPEVPYLHDYIGFDWNTGAPKWEREFPTYCIVVEDALGQRIQYDNPDLHYHW